MKTQEELFESERRATRNGGSFYFLVILVLALLVLPFLFIAKKQPAGAVLGVSADGTEQTVSPDAIRPAATIAFPKSNERTFAPVIPVNTSQSSYEMPQGSFAVFDCDSNSLIYGENQDEIRSIASISKLFAAVVLLDEASDLNKYYRIKQSDIIDEGVRNVYVGQDIRIIDLLGASLVGSDNSATRALVSAANLTEDEFVGKMNKRVRELGLKNTSFRDVVGLSKYNLSTAAEVSRFTKIALNYSEIKRFVAKSTYSFKPRNSDKETIVRTTNTLLATQKKSNIRSLGGKTGFTNEAGYCFTGKFQDKEKDIIVTVLGDGDKNARLNHAAEIADWVFENFAW